MPVMFTPQQGQQYVSVSGDLVFSTLFPPRREPQYFFSNETLCVGLELSWRDDRYTPHLIYFLFCGRVSAVFPPKLNSLTLKE